MCLYWLFGIHGDRLLRYIHFRSSWNKSYLAKYFCFSVFNIFKYIIGLKRNTSLQYSCQVSLLFLFPTFVKSFPQWERFWHMCWYSSGAFASRDAISTRFSLGRWATMSLECCSISWGWSVSPWSFLLFSRRTGSCAEISVRLAPELAPYVRDQIPPVGIQFFSIIFF